jgi:biotin carboxyl carrier protein
MTREDADLDRIKELIEIMKANELLELEIKHGDDKIFLKRDQLGPKAAAPSVGTDISSATAGPNTTQTPVSGAGLEQTAMPEHEGLVEIKSPKADTSGTIVEILVRNGQAVEYGQVLFNVKPDQ